MYEKSGSEKGEKKGLGVPAGRAVPGGGGGECSPEEKQTSRCPETLYPSWMSESSSGDCQRLREGKRGEAERCCGGTALRPQSRHGARGGGGEEGGISPSRAVGELRLGCPRHHPPSPHPAPVPE